MAWEFVQRRGVQQQCLAAEGGSRPVRCSMRSAARRYSCWSASHLLGYLNSAHAAPSIRLQEAQRPGLNAQGLTPLAHASRP